MTMTSKRQTMSQSKPIPQMDLAAQYAAIGGEIRKAVTQVLSSQQFVLGKEGAALEREIAELCGVQHGIGVASGTDALTLALRAAGVAAADEVILAPFTFVATGSALSALGAKPLQTSTQSAQWPDEISRVTPRPAQFSLFICTVWRQTWIQYVIRRASWDTVVEYNAQAIGALQRQPTGALGDIACVVSIQQEFRRLRRRRNDCYELPRNRRKAPHAQESRAGFALQQRGAGLEQQTGRNSGRNITG
jgi:hypothetical protein